MYQIMKATKTKKSVLPQVNAFGIQLHEKAVFRPDLPYAWFTHDQTNGNILSMGIGTGSDMPQSGAGVLSVFDRQTKTWPIRQECEPKGMKISAGSFSPFLCTQKGTLIFVFSNKGESSAFLWDSEAHDMPGASTPTYVTRSLDGGQTWSKPHKLHDEWTGANRAILQTKTGAVVFTSMKMLHHPGRHSVLTYRSEDEGASWVPSPTIDLGGIGHHGGVTEAAMIELNDGRILQYLRTNWWQFWKAVSVDDGKVFHPYGPSGIDASSAPGYLLRLKSGRIALIWNRFSPEGTQQVTLKGGDGNWSETPTSNFRAELSLSFSENDGDSWSEPIVVARNPEGQISYPCAFEAAPGEIWITTQWTRYQGQSGCNDEAALRFSLLEKHFV
ncbi:MAG: exo-alpha-sialidase [Ruminococcaceae bacterium]|nr:exo-alpha-sialidase [Oscillospiraceae bacterium]